MDVCGQGQKSNFSCRSDGRLNFSCRSDGRREIGRAGSHDGSRSLSQVSSGLLIRLSQFSSSSFSDIMSKFMAKPVGGEGGGGELCSGEGGGGGEHGGGGGGGGGGVGGGCGGQGGPTKEQKQVNTYLLFVLFCTPA